MTEIQKKQNPTSVDRSRPRGHLGCKKGCLEYKAELLGARKWPGSGDACHFSQKVEDFSRFFEIGSFRPWRRRRWSFLDERSRKPVFPLRTDHGKWLSLKTRKIRRFPRCTSRPRYWPVTRLGHMDMLVPVALFLFKRKREKRNEQ
jgi:hypothetical protein